MFPCGVIDKSVRDAISSRNEAFVDTFHNAVKEAIHGFPVGQVGPAYYNILDPSTQGTNQVSTSHQEAAPAGNNDVQEVQGLSKQAQALLQNKGIVTLACNTSSMCS